MIGQRDPSAMTREELEEEVAWLRSEMGLSVDAGQAADVALFYGLTKQQGTLLLILHRVRPRMLSVAFLNDALYGRDHRGRVSDKIVDVLVHRIRKAVGAGVIENLRGSGYRLTDAGAAVVEAALRLSRPNGGPPSDSNPTPSGIDGDAAVIC